MSVTLPQSATDLRSEVRAFLEADRAEHGWRGQCDAWLTGFDAGFSGRVGERGWLGMTWPEAYGGHERSSLERYVVTEELLAAGAPVAAHWIADRQTGPLLLTHGTDEQRERLLGGIARGEVFFAIGMSEPDSGSDLASVRTRAERVAGGWAVSGTKVWTSHAHHCHHMIALVRTSPRDDERRHAGLSQLIVDLDADGVEVRPIRVMTGEHHFNEVILDEAFVPDAMVVGEVGQGWHQVTSELAYERSGPERFLSTLPVLTALVDRLGADAGDHAAQRVGAVVARLSALRALSLGLAAQLEARADPAVQAALVKDLGTRFEREITAAARELCPLEPDLDSADPLAVAVAEAVLTSPGGTLRGGTSEILRGIVAKSLGA